MKTKIITAIVMLIVINVAIFAKSNVKQPDTYAYTRGVEAFNEDNYEEALEWFNTELAEHPDNGYAHFYISVIRYGNQEYGQALSAINNALKHLPKKDKTWRSGVYATRAELYLAMQDTVKALADLTEAIKIDPSNTSFYSSRGQLYFEQKNYALSDADYQSIIKLDQGDVDGYMGVGRNAKAEGRWDDAISQFNHVILMEPDYSSGYSFRAEAYAGKKKWNEATDDIVKALEIDSDYKAFYQMQDYPAEALELLRPKLKIEMAKQPTNNSWPYCLGVLAEREENYDEAISYYEKANAIDANLVLLRRIAECYMNKQEDLTALEYLDKALAMSPDDYDVLCVKALLLNNLGEEDECIAELDKCVAKYPDKLDAYLYRADILLNSRYLKRAIEDYNMAAVLEPSLFESPYFLMKLGDAYRLNGMGETAGKYYEQLLAVEKGSVLTGKSWTPFAYSGLGDAEKANEAMQYILANDTTDVKGSLYNAACVYARLGQKEKSIKYLSEAISQGFNDLELIETDYDLDCIRNTAEYEKLIDSNFQVTQIAIVDADSPEYYVEEPKTVEVPFTKENGVTKVKCEINGLPLHFVFDTGAAEVTMSMVEANFMVKNDYIREEDVIGSARYMDANGDITEGTVVNLRKVNFGGLELDNVRATVVRNQNAPLLLGQSVLGRLGKIEIDNTGLKLIITHIESSNGTRF